MNGQQVFEAVRSLLATPAIPVLDEVRTTPGKPYYWVGVSQPWPQVTALAERRRLGRCVVTVMAVNNSPSGCRHLMGRAIDLLQGVRLAPDDWPLTTTYTPTAPIEDDGPGDLRWSSTVEFAFHTHR